ncbi:MAG: glycosyltransferase family 4 protein, partial [Lentisphaeraceae bacterium]|nr:glycosyltransferase family 4 protein [Lentisphaeraceae bacterium]
MAENRENSEITKVCHVVRRFVKEKWGGTESVVYYLADQYEQKGVKSPILTTSMFSKKGLQEFGRVAVYRFAYFLPWLGLNNDAKEKLREKGGSPISFSLLKFLWSQKDCSIIHTHTAHRLGGIARTVARLREIPYVVSLHGGCLTLPDEQAEAMQEPFKGKFEWGKVFGLLFGSRKVLSDADAIICVGRDEYELMQQRYPNKRVYYQPNGVSTSFFAEAKAKAFRDKYDIPFSEKIILCISRI